MAMLSSASNEFRPGSNGDNPCLNVSSSTRRYRSPRLPPVIVEVEERLLRAKKLCQHRDVKGASIEWNLLTRTIRTLSEEYTGAREQACLTGLSANLEVIRKDILSAEGKVSEAHEARLSAIKLFEEVFESQIRLSGDFQLRREYVFQCERASLKYETENDIATSLKYLIKAQRQLEVVNINLSRSEKTSAYLESLSRTADCHLKVAGFNQALRRYEFEERHRIAALSNFYKMIDIGLPYQKVWVLEGRLAFQYNELGKIALRRRDLDSAAGYFTKAWLMYMDRRERAVTPRDYSDASHRAGIVHASLKQINKLCIHQPTNYSSIKKVSR